jgi:hypothetical protein
MQVAGVRSHKTSQRFLPAAAAVAGSVSGRLALDAVAERRPTGGWRDLAGVVVASADGRSLVFALQGALGRTTAPRRGWIFFLGLAVSRVSGGLAARVIAERDAGCMPASGRVLAMEPDRRAGRVGVRGVSRRQMTSTTGPASWRR